MHEKFTRGRQQFQDNDVNVRRRAEAEKKEPDILRMLVRDRTKQAQSLPPNFRISEFKTQQDRAIQPDHETEQRSDSQTRGSEAGGDVGNRHRSEKELNSLQRTIDRIIDNLMPFFREYIGTTKGILAQLPGVIEHLQLPGAIEHLQEGSTKEIKLELELKLDSEQWKELKIDKPAKFLFWIDYYEKKEQITHASIPDKIKHLKKCLWWSPLSGQKETQSVTIDYLGTEQKFLRKHIEYLTLLQKTLQKQPNELDKEVYKYKHKRKELINLTNRLELQNKLKKAKEEYLSFLEEQSLPPRIKQHILEKISKNYRTEGVEQLILDGTTKLAELASETIFDKKIEELQNLQKSAAKHLNSENYEGSSFFLKSQKRETGYYSRHRDLALIRQMRGRGCGNIATLMTAADVNKRYLVPTDDRNEDLLMAAPMERYYSSEVEGRYGYSSRPHRNLKEIALVLDRYRYSYGYRPDHNLEAIALDRYNALDMYNALDRYKVEGFMKEFDRLLPPELGLERGTANAIMFPIVLKRIGHPIEYDYFNDENVSHNKWDTRNIMLPPYLCEEYFSSTGRPLQSITVEQFKNAIKKKEKGTIITPLVKKYEDKSFLGHVILIDAIETIDGEEHIIYRDPQFGTGAAVSWKDFLECWSGEAIIPRGVV